MPTYTHGGDRYGRAAIRLDFSANLHPLGMPPAVRAAAEAAVGEADHYPDALCTQLRQAIGRRWQLPPEAVICGCGAADLILRLVTAVRPQSALVLSPTFSEYEEALATVGCAVTVFPLSPQNDFDVTEDILEALTPALSMVFLCSPNNPTGRLIPKALLRNIAEKTRENGTIFVLDECFISLTEGESMADTLEEFPNLFLLRAFTKSYAIPGLRLGYGLCQNGALMERLYRCGQPWGVSTVAQAAGLAALTIPQYPHEGRAVLDRERPYLLEGLRAMGCRVIEGRANYLLFQRPGDTDLKERLLEKGILIRSCCNYRGLGSDWYRIAIMTHEKNEILLTTMKEVL